MWSEGYDFEICKGAEPGRDKGFIWISFGRKLHCLDEIIFNIWFFLCLLHILNSLRENLGSVSALCKPLLAEMHVRLCTIGPLGSSPSPAHSRSLVHLATLFLSFNKEYKWLQFWSLLCTCFVQRLKLEVIVQLNDFLH